MWFLIRLSSQSTMWPLGTSCAFYFLSLLPGDLAPPPPWTRGKSKHTLGVGHSFDFIIPEPHKCALGLQSIVKSNGKGSKLRKVNAAVLVLRSGWSHRTGCVEMASIDLYLLTGCCQGNQGAVRRTDMVNGKYKTFSGLSSEKINSEKSEMTEDLTQSSSTILAAHIFSICHKSSRCYEGLEV
jgi:hypothetical protein